MLLLLLRMEPNEEVGNIFHYLLITDELEFELYLTLQRTTLRVHGRNSYGFLVDHNVLLTWDKGKSIE